MALWIAEVQLRKAAFVHRVSFGVNDEMAMAAEERMAPADLLDGTERPGMSVFAGPEEDDRNTERRMKNPAWAGIPGFD